LPVSRSSVELPAARDVVAQYPPFETALGLYMGVAANPASLGVVLGPFAEVREAMYEGIEEMLVGGKDPVEGLDDAAAKANQAIDKYNQSVK
jgi:ABC-type glycerol-3-phosphate transport system substrate-binding protein